MSSSENACPALWADAAEAGEAGEAAAAGDAGPASPGPSGAAAGPAGPCVPAVPAVPACGAAALAREVAALAARPPEGVTICPRGDRLDEITAYIEGPPDTPYWGGVWEVRLVVPAAYPGRPPAAWFVTRVFHPNVCPRGRACVSTLGAGWRPALGLAGAAVAVRELLAAPNAASALDEAAARLLQDHRDAFIARARLITDLYARRQPAATTTTTTTAATAPPAPATVSATTPSAATRRARDRRRLKRL